MEHEMKMKHIRWIRSDELGKKMGKLCAKSKRRKPLIMFVVSYSHLRVCLYSKFGMKSKEILIWPLRFYSALRLSLTEARTSLEGMHLGQIKSTT